MDGGPPPRSPGDHLGPPRTVGIDRASQKSSPSEPSRTTRSIGMTRSSIKTTSRPAVSRMSDCGCPLVRPRNLVGGHRRPADITHLFSRGHRGARRGAIGTLCRARLGCVSFRNFRAPSMQEQAVGQWVTSQSPPRVTLRPKISLDSPTRRGGRPPRSPECRFVALTRSPSYDRPDFLDSAGQPFWTSQKPRDHTASRFRRRCG